MTTRTGVYPGTFDPITLGHMDIIRRGAKLVDRLVIGVTTNPSKNPMFSVEERLAMVRREVEGIPGDIEVVSFDSLLMDFATREGASVIVRGLRDGTDFDYEMQMAGMNGEMAPDIQTVYVAASPRVRHIAANLVRAVVSMGGDPSPFVSKDVLKRLKAKSAKTK